MARHIGDITKRYLEHRAAQKAWRAKMQPPRPGGTGQTIQRTSAAMRAKAAQKPEPIVVEPRITSVYLPPAGLIARSLLGPVFGRR